VDRVLVPGERGDRLTAQRLAAGEIEVEDNLYRAVREAAGL
jgi:hypothetical protein